MAMTPDEATLIVADSYGKRLTAFDIRADGSLSGPRVWADLGEGTPDGICMDAEGAIWYADVPNKRCVRVNEGGVTRQTVHNWLTVCAADSRPDSLAGKDGKTWVEHGIDGARLVR